jgi:signal transduction histidine kinase
MIKTWKPGRPDAGGGAGSARRWSVDVLIAAAVTGAQLGAMSWHGRQHAAGSLDYALLAVAGAALLGRRRFPVAVLAVTLAASLIAGRSGSPLYLLLTAAFVNAVLAGQRVAAIASLVIGYLAAVWPPWLIGARQHTTATAALGLLCGLLVLLGAAELIRARNQRAQALQHSREEELRRRAGEERMRIARDLHDVVAHNISVINVQASTALHLMDRQPERARAALSAINDVSRQALVELRYVLGVLRGADESAPRAPSPGLARLGELVDSAAATGLAVAVEEEGPQVRLPGNVDLAAYRIVQEALTNSARHSGGAVATVRVSYGERELMIEVADDGAGRPDGGRPPAGGDGAGHGIAGMTERAHALGGTLDAGRRPEGGFRVLARLPLNGARGDPAGAERGAR